MQHQPGFRVSLKSDVLLWNQNPCTKHDLKVYTRTSAFSQVFIWYFDFATVHFSLAVSVTIYSKRAHWKWFYLEGTTRFENLYPWLPLTPHIRISKHWHVARVQTRISRNPWTTRPGGNAEIAAKELLSVFPQLSKHLEQIYLTDNRQNETS